MNVAALLQDSPSSERRPTTTTPSISSPASPSNSPSDKEKDLRPTPVVLNALLERDRDRERERDRDRDIERERERETNWPAYHPPPPTSSSGLYEPSPMYTGVVGGSSGGGVGTSSRERERERRDREELAKIAERERKDREWVMHASRPHAATKFAPPPPPPPPLPPQLTHLLPQPPTATSSSSSPRILSHPDDLHKDLPSPHSERDRDNFAIEKERYYLPKPGHEGPPQTLTLLPPVHASAHAQHQSMHSMRSEDEMIIERERERERERDRIMGEREKLERERRPLTTKELERAARERELTAMKERDKELRRLEKERKRMQPHHNALLQAPAKEKELERDEKEKEKEKEREREKLRELEKDKGKEKEEEVKERHKPKPWPPEREFKAALHYHLGNWVYPDLPFPFHFGGTEIGVGVGLGPRNAPSSDKEQNQPREKAQMVEEGEIEENLPKAATALTKADDPEEMVVDSTGNASSQAHTSTTLSVYIPYTLFPSCRPSREIRTRTLTLRLWGGGLIPPPPTIIPPPPSNQLQILHQQHPPYHPPPQQPPPELEEPEWEPQPPYSTDLHFRRRVYTDDSDLVPILVHAGFVRWSDYVSHKTKDKKDLKVIVRVIRGVREVSERRSVEGANGIWIGDVDERTKVGGGYVKEEVMGRFIGGWGEVYHGGVLSPAQAYSQAKAQSDEEGEEDDGRGILSAGWGAGHDGSAIEIVSVEWVEAGSAFRGPSVGMRNRKKRLREYASGRSTAMELDDEKASTEESNKKVLMGWGNGEHRLIQH